MISSPSCPVCDSGTTESLGARTYSAKDIPHLDIYTSKRYRVLFEVWFPGKSEVTFESKLCKICGMVFSSPRPTEEDLSNAQSFMSQLGPWIISDVDGVESLRAKDLFCRLARYAHKGSRALDFGGGDGHLMTPFVDHGCDCFLVDYYPSPVSIVRKLGDTIDELPDNMIFDLIICSHVFEHLIDPFSMLVKLRRHLSKDGILYIEVPMELWRRIPLDKEPLTHINFFTVQSLRFLMERASLRMISCRMGAYLHTSGSKQTAVRAIFTPADKVQLSYPVRAAHNTKKIIYPSLFLRLQMLTIHPEWLFLSVYHRLRRILNCDL